ncbi:MAG TPA: hypothetical protein VI790_01960 [Candidatus Nanoarchaeia archaeon]|nr:hypothetical protein [Candidatus Nanoarchaeia archaeon]
MTDRQVVLKFFKEYIDSWIAKKSLEKPVASEPDILFFEYANLDSLLANKSIEPGSIVNITAESKEHLMELFNNRKLFSLTLNFLSVSGCPFYGSSNKTCFSNCDSFFFYEGRSCKCLPYLNAFRDKV